MIIKNNFNNKTMHTIDRLPGNEQELDYIKKLFPDSIVERKSNNFPMYLKYIKFKNLHWYK